MLSIKVISYASWFNGKAALEKEILSEFSSVKNPLSLCVCFCVRACVCSAVAADRGFSCLGICLRLVCTWCVFLLLLLFRGDPTHRLSRLIHYSPPWRDGKETMWGREKEGGEGGGGSEGGGVMHREKRSQSQMTGMKQRGSIFTCRETIGGGCSRWGFVHF